MSNTDTDLSALLNFHSQLRAYHFAISSGQLSLSGTDEVTQSVVGDASGLISAGLRAYQSITGDSDKAVALGVLTKQKTKTSWRRMAMAETVEGALRLAVANSSYVIERIYDGNLDDVAKDSFANVVQMVDAACEDLARGVSVSYYGLDHLAKDLDFDGPSL
jgi:hypothetical protein